MRTEGPSDEPKDTRERSSVSTLVCGVVWFDRCDMVVWCGVVWGGVVWFGVEWYDPRYAH